MFYWSLGNIQPSYRSKLTMMNLLAIGKAVDLKNEQVGFHSNSPAVSALCMMISGCPSNILQPKDKHFLMVAMITGREVCSLLYLETQPFMSSEGSRRVYYSHTRNVKPVNVVEKK